MIRGITFSEQTFYSADFAHYMNFFLQGGVGITKGCLISNDGTKVTIGTGYFVAHGRLMNVEAAEVVDATRGFETGYNRIVYEIDLSQENTITDFRQGAIRVLQTEELIQEDLDADGSVYQFPLCHFQWSGSAITDFIIDAPTLVMPDIFQQWAENYEAVNAQFDVWFAEKKAEVEAWLADEMETVEKLVEGLEAGGFEKKAIYSSVTMLAANWVDAEYSFEADYPFVNYDLEIQPDGDSATTEQMEAFGGAMVAGSRTSNIVKAKGDVPAVDIPIILKVVRKYD